MKIDYDISIEPGQAFEIDRFRPEDAEGIAHLVFAEYGAAYPIDTYYFPERIAEENNNGNIYSVVARTPRGDIIGHMALYRSSPPYPNLYEIGQGIVLPSYRTTFAAYKINLYIGEKLAPFIRTDGIFGEAVCHITATQKSSAIIGMKDVALEIDLMPAEAYDKAKCASGRVSCVILFRSFNDRPHEVFIPPVYHREIDYIAGDIDIDRKMTPSNGEIPQGTKSDVRIRFFNHAGVGRFAVVASGSDFETVVEELEKEGAGNGTLVLQYFLNLAEPWVGEAVECLRKRGYFFGGYVPRWFDTDSMLMQKISTSPDFSTIKLHSEKAQQILEFVRSDWKRAGS
ncbi:MAG: hypothetical protein AB9866_07785 [Syntrophobacteraceae bacterium]